MDIEKYENLANALECQSCTYERAVCLQEGCCLQDKEEEFIKIAKSVGGQGISLFPGKNKHLNAFDTVR